MQPNQQDEHEAEPPTDVQDDNGSAMSVPDEDVYQRMDEVDVKDDDMIGKLVGIINSTVSEVYSPPRIAPLAAEYGMKSGFSLDITVDDETGQP